MYLLEELLAGFSPSHDSFIFMWLLLFLALIAAGLVAERWLEIRRRTDVNNINFINKISSLIKAGRLDEAGKICLSGGVRALPAIVGSGIINAKKSPDLARYSMEEVFLKVLPSVDKRIPMVLMISNVATLIGLMGTIYGIILSFSAISTPDVAAIEKSALLAQGISTAMNTTLLGLVISIPCLVAYFYLQNKVERVVQELDRFSLHILRLLTPSGHKIENHSFSSKRMKEEIDAQPNMSPMMSLIVILIPLLLTSAEFVKVGTIEMRGADPSKQAEQLIEADKDLDAKKLNLRIAVLDDGFNVFHSFGDKAESDGKSGSKVEEKKTEIPMDDGAYDFAGLKEELETIKRKVLYEILKEGGLISEEADHSIASLFERYLMNKDTLFSGKLFPDHESARLSAFENADYQTIISVMDAAREVHIEGRGLPMFPDIALAGGKDLK